MSLKTWERRKGDENSAKLIRAQFEDEAKPFTNVIRTFAHAYNPKLRANGNTGITDKPDTYEKWKKELEALNVICQKYPNLKNQPFADEPAYSDNIAYRHADWCAIAAQPAKMIGKIKITIADSDAQYATQGVTNQVNGVLRDPNGLVRDDLQILLYEHATWEQQNLQKIKNKYAEAGEPIPPTLFAALDEKVKELKVKIESDAPTRSWTETKFKDAALEALARNKFAAEIPGSKVLKTGMNFTTWEARDDTTYIGDGFYRITPGAYRFKLGLALVKIPNRPFCQIREFQLTQHRTGAGYGAAKAMIGGGGIFVKCP